MDYAEIVNYNDELTKYLSNNKSTNLRGMQR